MAMNSFPARIEASTGDKSGPSAAAMKTHTLVWCKLINERPTTVVHDNLADKSAPSL